MSPVSEGLLAFIALLAVIMILGLAWLVYLGRGGKPFRVSIRGLGIRVNVSPNPEDEKKDTLSE